LEREREGGREKTQNKGVAVFIPKEVVLKEIAAKTE
jgi:hypothetical protein